MSSFSTPGMPLSLRKQPFALNDTRGTFAISLFICTEATLFVALFVTYYYLASLAPHWPPDPPPDFHIALVMLAVLLASSAVLHWGEKQLEKRRPRAAMTALVVTILMGLGFLVLSVFDFEARLRVLSPTHDAYSALFYTTVTLHAAHVVIGLCMLTFVLILPSFEPRSDMPHRPYHNAALYWHFVDAVWIFVVLLLYVIPGLRR